jgi:ribosome-associated protein
MAREPFDVHEMARQCARLADDRKARDIVILDVEEMLFITSCFVIATGQSRKQLQAIADSIHKEMKKRGYTRLGLEGYDDGQWVLLDYGDVIVQLLDEESRARYNLELIWGDAPRVAWEPEPNAEASTEDESAKPAT